MNKILVLSPWFVPAWEAGGTAVAAYNTAKILKDLGYEVLVYTTRENGRKKLVNSGLGYVGDIPTVYFNYSSLLKGSAWSPSMLYRLIRTIRGFDVVHINGVRTAYELVVLILKQTGFFKGEIIITPHAALRRDWLSSIGNTFLSNYYTTKISRLYSKCTLHFLSQQEMIDSPVLAKKAVVIPNFIERVQVEELKTTKRGSFLMICRVHPQKNIVRAIELISQEENSILDIYGPIGDITYYRALKKIIEERRLVNRVRFMGVIENTRLGEIFSDYYAFILSSDVEGVSMSLLEASSAGIPTLYSNGIGNLSTMKAYLPGLLVQNWNSAKEQLEHLHSNYDKLSDRSRELYENEYSYASVKISWKALLEDEIFSGTC